MVKEFQTNYQSSQILQEIQNKIALNLATYKDANAYAIELGQILSDIFKANITADVLPNGKMYFNIGKKVIEPLMINNYELISNKAKEVQTILNKKAKIGIVGQKADLNQDRIDGLIQKIANADKFNDVKWLLDEPIVNFSQSIVDDTIRKNAQFHYDAGLSPKIIRTANSGCCDWCEEIVGTYEYKDVSDTGNNVFRRHKRCRCEVDYVPGDGRKQNAHTKAWR